MRTLFRRALLALVLALSFVAAAAVLAQEREITVSAAISLKEAVEEAAAAYQKAKPGSKVICNFGSSGTLQHQIEQGAPVDVFISASPKQMDELEVKGLLLGGTRMDLLTNTVVLIAPRDSTLVTSFQDLARPEVNRVALGEPNTVPAGTYAQQVLEYLKILDRVRAKAVYAKDVRQVLTYVETGNVDAGIVYVTDARTSEKIKVVAAAPSGSHTPVIYPVAGVKATRQEAVARDFVQFLSGSAARGIFEKYGFGTAPL